MEQMLSCLALAAVAAALIWASVEDLRARTIPNACPIVVIAAWFARALSGADTSVRLVEGLWGLVTVSVLLVVCDLASKKLLGAKGIGGGDVKLLGSLGMWTGRMPGLFMIGASCLIAVLGLGTAAFVSRLRPKEGDGSWLHKGIPMAPAIAGGFFITLYAKAMMGDYT